MIRDAFITAMLAAAFVACLFVGSATAHEPVFDDQAMHPQLLPRGSLESAFALKRKSMAQTPRPAADAQQIGEALTDCELIRPLSMATREKCEIRARQSAAGRVPAVR